MDDSRETNRRWCLAFIAVLLFAAAACAPEEPAEPEVRWMFVRDANDRPILGVEAEIDGDFDLRLQGGWTVTAAGLHAVRVEGPGRIDVGDRSFHWDGVDLTDRVTGEVATRGKCTFVRRGGAVYEDLPFR